MTTSSNSFSAGLGMNEEAIRCPKCKTNTYAIVWRLQTAKKPETRGKRMKTILEILKNGELFHP